MDNKQKAEAFEKAIAKIVDKVWPTVEADLKKAEEDFPPEVDEEEKDEEKEDAEKAEGDPVEDEKKEEEKEEEDRPQGDEEKLEKLAAAFDEDKDEEDEDKEKEVEENAEEAPVEKADEEVVEEKKDEEKEEEKDDSAEKALKEQVDALQKAVVALTDRLEKVAHSPSGVRKSVDGKTVAKSGDKEAPKDITMIKKAAIKNTMVELMQKGEIKGEEVTRYELTGRIADADVRKKVLKALNK